MQKTYPKNHHYAKRGVALCSTGFTDMLDTQFGHTSTYCRLELHLGDHIYRKRGGSQSAFLPDAFDYRYQSLAKSLGVEVCSDKIVGGLLGNYYEQDDNGVIRFRISEEGQGDLVIFWRYDRDTYRAVCQLEPTAISVAQNMEWFQAVFSLARKNDVGSSDEFYDDFYDCEPDSVDVYGSHWVDSIDDGLVIAERLHLCGF